MKTVLGKQLHPLNFMFDISQSGLKLLLVRELEAGLFVLGVAVVDI